MTPSELKYKVEEADTAPHFFTRETMRFHGDTMRNYGVTTCIIRTLFDDEGKALPEGFEREVWELYRKRPVKGGSKGSAYFDKRTFKRVFPLS